MKVKALAAFALATVLLLSISLTALAVDYDKEYLWQFSWKIKETTTLYKDDGEGGLTASGTITVGTYVRLVLRFDGNDGVEYARILSMNGTSGVVVASALKTAIVFIGDESYHELEIHEKDRDKAESSGGSGSSGTNQGSGSGSKPGSKSTSKLGSEEPEVKRYPIGTIFYQDEVVELQTMGLVTCTILKGTEELEVPTSELTFETQAPEEQRYAVIYAPRTGTCSLREEPYGYSKLLVDCMAGMVVPVLHVGSGWTRILYEGHVGYVRNNCLEFYPADVRAISTAIITRSNGQNVSMRNSMGTGSWMVMSLPVGTEVTVFNREGEWAEIEYAGLHGFVKTHLAVDKEGETPQEEAPTEEENSPEAEEAPEELPGNEDLHPDELPIPI